MELVRPLRSMRGAVLDRGRLAVAAVVVGAIGLVIALTGPAPAPTEPRTGPAAVAVPAQACSPAWVTGWQASAQPGRPVAHLGGSTLRMVVRPQVAGSQIRVRLSNAYGRAPMTVGVVSAAQSDGEAGLVAGTGRTVAFGGQASVVIPPGAAVVSDPIPLVAEPGSPLAISMFIPVAPDVVTQHALALQTSYLSRRGDATFADGAGYTIRLQSWLVLTGLDVLTPRPVNAVVAVGDSITDGLGSEIDKNQRWSDALSGVLAEVGGPTTMAVLNAGISGSRLLTADPARDGDSALTRFDSDVAAATGATDVVLHIGTNDIAAGSDTATVVAGLQQFAERTRAAGKRIFLTTITPATAGMHGAPAAVATRSAVNAWVRAHGSEYADGVFDFAAAVTDPARPARLAAAYDAGDGLHLSAAGNEALARAVDPLVLTGSPCLADTAPAPVGRAGG